jgi:hypothetical protein
MSSRFACSTSLGPRWGFGKLEPGHMRNLQGMTERDDLQDNATCNLAGNLGWTSELGQAFQNRQSDVMAAVQVMRAKAQAAGTPQSTPQIKVVRQSPQTIHQIEPAQKL